MNREQKQQAVADIKAIFDSSNSVMVFHYRGITVSDATILRQKAKENGGNVKVVKNTLARIAANDTSFSILSDLLSGPTAIVFSEDEVSAAKTLSDFAKDNDNVVILGGAFNGTLLDESGVNALANTPSLDESRGKLVGLLQAPAAKLASICQAPAGQLARVINAHAQNQS